MDESSLLGQHHEFLFVLSKPSLFRRKGKHHAEGSETKVSLLDFKKPLERKTNFCFRFGCFQYTAESAAGFNLCSREHMETCEGQRSKFSNELSWVASRQSVSREHIETCALCVSVQGGPGNRCKVLKIILKGQGCISTICKSLIICLLKVFEKPSTEIVSLLSCEFDEKTNVLIWRMFMSTTKSWAELQWQFGGVQKRRLRCAQLERNHAEVDLESESRDSESLLIESTFLHGWDPLCFMTK